jgi:hypothetical protein
MARLSNVPPVQKYDSSIVSEAPLHVCKEHARRTTTIDCNNKPNRRITFPIQIIRVMIYCVPLLTVIPIIYCTHNICVWVGNDGRKTTYPKIRVRNNTWRVFQPLRRPGSSYRYISAVVDCLHAIVKRGITAVRCVVLFMVYMLFTTFTVKGRIKQVREEGADDKKPRETPSP